jgi:2-octaprenyl-6-methoxyphenol hydroxylase
MLMPEQVAWPVVFIGNAAHTLHPVAGQGFNLGLRDVAALAQCIIQQGIQADMLIAYQAMRQSDQRTIARLTHGLVRIFGSQLPGMAWGRGLGMMVMDNTPYLKSLLSLYAGGYAGMLPDLVCGIRLDKEIY